MSDTRKLQWSTAAGAQRPLEVDRKGDGKDEQHSELKILYGEFLQLSFFGGEIDTDGGLLPFVGHKRLGIALFEDLVQCLLS